MNVHFCSQKTIKDKNRDKRRPAIGAIVIFGFLLTFSCMVRARPEYAVRFGINRCTACHYSPAGGGPRNIDGKYFGAFGYKSSTWAQQDYLGAEMKILYTRPAESEYVKDGMGIMNGTVWGSVPIRELTDDESEIRLVAEQNLGGFNPSPRQWYARWSVDPRDSRTGWLPQYVVVGRMIPAYGLMSDEHLTYVRIQTGTSWITGFDTGVSVAANPVESIHYDLAITDGQKSLGQGVSQNLANLWGAVANLRWMPISLPFMLGASAEQYSAGSQSNGAYAWSAYTSISFHRLTRNRVPVTLSFEFDQAKNWNALFGSGFVSDQNYLNSVTNTISQGLYGLLDWQVTKHFSVQYKFDQLTLDQSYPSDAYQRHGVGFKHYFAANMWGLVRYEKALCGRSGESGGLSMGALDGTYAILSISL